MSGGFSRGIREFWKEAAKHQFGEVNGRAPDLRLVYDEQRGFHFSGLAADEVHHIKPGSFAEANGQAANDQAGLPVAREGHRGAATLPFDESYSFHPDMAQAARKYRKGDKKAYEQARARHKAEALMGGLPPGFDPELAALLEEMMVEAAVRYTAETGIKKPVTTRKVPPAKRWYDGLF